ncbi:MULTISPECIES: DUF3945 domain-containing protein [Larkinella]|jgi:hypothetical protein|uniref:DUF3945 domain-containing protein n=1 Tax=Larkinella punicea TaxID=2315727 RepID=A0A368JIF4_9BACT|nr:MULTISPECIES: DUF3945 domain-containing protein [Larkinella]RCR67075.1 DUF3945 domain-containing protein [Larkinella punicea]
MQNQDFARTQADGLDNIAPTATQAAAASQYAVTDGFLSSSEQEAVLRQIATERPVLQKKLDEVGIDRVYLAMHPEVEQALFSGKQTPVVTIQLPNELELQGRLRIALTDQGPQLRITPVHPELEIPEKVGDLKLTPQERSELEQKGYVDRSLAIAENGGFVSGFLRVDNQTNTVDLWRVNPETLPSKLLGIDLTRDQQIALVCGHPVKLSGLKDKQGEPFDATVSISAGKQGLQFSDIGRPDLSLKPDEKFKQQLGQNNEGAKTDHTRGLEERAGQSTVANAQTETIKRLMDPDEKPDQHKLHLRPGHDKI